MGSAWTNRVAGLLHGISRVFRMALSSDFWVFFGS